MIKKLKLKFIILSMTSLFVLLAVIVVGMNVINYTSVTKEADEILELMSKNKGTFPGVENAPEFPGGEQMRPIPDKAQGGRLPHDMSPETPYESRYFSALISGSGEIIFVDMSNIAAIDESSAKEYADQALASKKENGFADDFRYIKTDEGENTRITFLDWGRKLNSFRSFLLTSVIIALAGYALVFLVICFFAGKIIRPIAESYEKQKRFITDAGHEIKTPLTVIKANIDLLEMEFGQNESVTDIKQQAECLTELTNDLVYLAKMDESGDVLPMTDFPLSEVIADTAAQFEIFASSEGKSFLCEISPMISIKGNAKAISQLVSILMDNALKYSDKSGKIELKLYKQGRSAVLSVFNTTSVDVKKDDLERVFDRFYRSDGSRNSLTGGHGIGLSIARAITEAHGGRISASTDDNGSFKITAVFTI